MVKITFEFPTIDAAIVALAKLNAPLPKNSSTQGSGSTPQPESTTRAPVGGGNPAVEESQAKQRKPRADKGKERGSYKNAGATGDSPSSTTGNPGSGANAVTTPSADNPPAAPTGAAAPAPNVAAPETGGATQSSRGTGEAGSALNSAPGAAAPSLDEAQAALSSVFEAHGLPLAQGVLSRFGVQRLRDLLPEQRAEFIEAAAKAVKEGKA